MKNGFLRAGLKRLSRRCNAGFTLIELLVTTVILSLLAALLFPLASKAREASQRAQCVSNLRQLFTGIQAYAADHAGAVPSMRNPAEPNQTYAEPTLNDHTYGAVMLIYPNYLQSKEPFVCPSDKDPNRLRWESENRSGLYTSYFAYRDLDLEGVLRRFTTTDPHFGGRLPLIGDAARTNFHKDGYNVCFMDGHIEFVSPSVVGVQPYVNFFWE